MAKNFAPRVSKKKLKKIDLTKNLSVDKKIIKANDDRLLAGARLQEVKLADIEVRKQVRTKFNDSSIMELAANIKENGLIQPLVIHRDGAKFILICGERRFRAMSTIKTMKKAPCFVLEGKTKEELMAIQFSENSAREDLHYIDQADSIMGYKKLTGASERKIQSALGISKSEVHRCLLIAKLPQKIKEAAKLYNTEKYVLLEWDALEDTPAKKKIYDGIIKGKISKRTQLKRAITTHKVIVKTGKKTRATRKPQASANVLIKALKSKSKDMKLDAKTKKLLDELMKDAKDMVDM
jgi:ParB family chromosome partitioning protein